MDDGITQTDDGRRLYPRLAAIVAAAATSPRWGVHDRALRAYADELLPTVLGGEWELDKGISAQPSPDYRNLIAPIYDHHAMLHRRGARKPHKWHNCAIVSQPYDHVFKNGAFSATAQALQLCGIGIWVSHELSSWYPGSTVLALVAAGLTPELAPLFGFRTMSDPAFLKTCAERSSNYG